MLGLAGKYLYVEKDRFEPLPLLRTEESYPLFENRPYQWDVFSEPEFSGHFIGHSASSISFAGRMWVIGGSLLAFDADEQIYDTVFVSVDGREWKRVSKIPEPLYDSSIVEFKKHLFLIGGINKDSKPSDAVYISPNGLSWKKAGQLPIPIRVRSQ